MPVLYRALYDFQAEDDSELDLKVGQFVQEHPSGQNQDGWAFVQNKDKAVGFVPIGYLEVYKDVATRMVEDLAPKVPSMASPAAALNKTLQSPGDEEPSLLLIPRTKVLQPSVSSGSISTQSSAISTPIAPITGSKNSSSAASALPFKDNSGVKSLRSVLHASKAATAMASMILPIPRSTFVPNTASAASLVPAAEREDLSTLKTVSSENFAKILNMQKDNFDILSDMAQGLTDSVSSYAVSQDKLLASLSAMEEYVNNERKNLLIVLDGELHDELLNKSAQLLMSSSNAK